MAKTFPADGMRYRIREWRYIQRLRMSRAYFPSRRLRQWIRTWRFQRRQATPPLDD
ncbi:MAG: hypothetical protein ACXWX5_09715 [Actinomycetota bacterium]